MTYKLLASGVQRIEDGACIPADLGNVDWVKYQAFLAAGGVPLPADVPNPKAAIQSQITTLEVAQLAPRFNREFDIGMAAKVYVIEHPGITEVQALANLINSQHPDYNIGVAKLKAFDDSIVALRTKMNALP